MPKKQTRRASPRGQPRRYTPAPDILLDAPDGLRARTVVEWLGDRARIVRVYRAPDGIEYIGGQPVLSERDIGEMARRLAERRDLAREAFEAAACPVIPLRRRGGV